MSTICEYRCRGGCPRTTATHEHVHEPQFGNTSTILLYSTVVVRFLNFLKIFQKSALTGVKSNAVIVSTSSTLREWILAKLGNYEQLQRVSIDLKMV